MASAREETLITCGNYQIWGRTEGVTPSESDHCFFLMYGDHVHQNDVYHIDIGIAGKEV